MDGQEYCQLMDWGGVTDDIYLFNASLREWEEYYLQQRVTRVQRRRLSVFRSWVTILVTI
jgi:hypothetical protein